MRKMNTMEVITSVQLVCFMCPECKYPMWVNQGDISDQTVEDIQTVKCWHCSVVSLVEYEFYEEDIPNLLMANSFKTCKEAFNV